MDAWTPPNHKVFVAITVHLERGGKPLSMLLDFIELAEVTLTYIDEYAHTNQTICLDRLVAFRCESCKGTCQSSG